MQGTLWFSLSTYFYMLKCLGDEKTVYQQDVYLNSASLFLVIAFGLLDRLCFYAATLHFFPEGMKILYLNHS